MSSQSYDYLRDRITPHVRNAIAHDIATLEADATIEDLEALAEFLEVEATQAEHDRIVDEVRSAMAPPPVETLDTVRIAFVTETLIASWTELLRWSIGTDEHLVLQDTLLPDASSMGRAGRAWRANITRAGLTEDLATGILASWLEEEPRRGVVLPWGGMIVHDKRLLIRAPEEMLERLRDEVYPEEEVIACVGLMSGGIARLYGEAARQVALQAATVLDPGAILDLGTGYPLLSMELLEHQTNRRAILCEAGPLEPMVQKVVRQRSVEERVRFVAKAPAKADFAVGSIGSVVTTNVLSTMEKREAVEMLRRFNVWGRGPHLLAESGSEAAAARVQSLASEAGLEVVRTFAVNGLHAILVT